MKMKIKLMLGLGFLFTMIFGITIFCTYYIQKLADDSNNILKDNYKSLEYSKKLLTILDAIDNNLTRNIFLKENMPVNKNAIAQNLNNQEQNFNKIVIFEEKNITEEKEKEFVDTLKQTFSTYSSMINTKILISYNSVMYSDYISSYKSLKKSIDKIYLTNANAIILKNQIAKDHSNRFIRNMAILGAIIIILGFAYFWYYPFYVSHSLNIISEKSEKLLKDLNIESKLDSKDEFVIIQNSLNLLEESIMKKQ